jgi:hypothetical protein
MTFRLSEVPTALSTQEKSTLFPRRDVYRILGIHCQLGMTGKAQGQNRLRKNAGLEKKAALSG